jgi:hypothetical protein
MQQTAGKVFARRYFYEEFLAGLMTERTLRACNFLTLLGEDFRELEHFAALGIPLYRVFSVEADHKIYRRQKARAKAEDLEVVLHLADLTEYIHGYQHTDHRISVFNLDICGQFLKDIDPILGELLLFARRNPSTVMATYSTGARDRATLMEGMKSLVILLWLAPEATHRLVRHLYSQYRSAELPCEGRDRDRVAKNMLLRTLFWLRSHMEHIMVGSYSLGLTSEETIHKALAEQNQVWQQFITSCKAPFTYEQIVEAVESIHRPTFGAVRMDMNFGEIETLTYASHNGFYHNCYFATYEHDGSTVALDTWLVETAAAMRRNAVQLIDGEGNQYSSTHGRVAVHTDVVEMWDQDDLKSNLRLVAVPPPPVSSEASGLVAAVAQDELPPETVRQIRELAQQNPDMKSSEISEKLSLRVPMAKIAAHVAVARRKK